MTITTKFSIGDSVWVKDRYGSHSFIVGRISISINGAQTSIFYSADSKGAIVYFESACYATKEELLASL